MHSTVGKTKERYEAKCAELSALAGVKTHAMAAKEMEKVLSLMWGFNYGLAQAKT